MHANYIGLFSEFVRLCLILLQFGIFIALLRRVDAVVFFLRDLRLEMKMVQRKIHSVLLKTKAIFLGIGTILLRTKQVRTQYSSYRYNYQQVLQSAGRLFKWKHDGDQEYVDPFFIHRTPYSITCIITLVGMMSSLFLSFMSPKKIKNNSKIQK